MSFFEANRIDILRPHNGCLRSAANRDPLLLGSWFEFNGPLNNISVHISESVSEKMEKEEQRQFQTARIANTAATQYQLYQRSHHKKRANLLSVNTKKRTLHVYAEFE